MNDDDTFSTQRYCDMAHLRAAARTPPGEPKRDPLRRFVRAPGEAKVARLNPTQDSERAVVAPR